MVDLRPQRKQIGFGDRAPVLKRREKIRLMLFLLVSVMFVGVMIDFWTDTPPTRPEVEAVSEESPEPELEAMAMIDLQRLEELPDYEAIKAKADDVGALLRDDKLVRYSLDPIDALSFAWARAQLDADRDDRPLPQAFSAVDLVHGKVRHGRPVIATGTLVELRQSSVPGLENESWYRLQVLLRNEDDVPVFMHVLAPEWAAPGGGDGDGLSPGLSLRVVGRYMGMADLPTAGGGSQRLPVVAASALAHQDASSVTNLMALSPLRASSGGGLWRPDPEVFEDVSDYPGNPRQSVLERRPYYYLLGQVKLDASTPDVYPEPLSMERKGQAVYEEPSAYRGEVFSVEGRVWDAWWDEQVAIDQPYGVDRVMRVWLWRVVYGIGDKPFRDLYELAVVAPSGKELPRRGEIVRATGRLLKVHLYHTPLNQFAFMLDKDMEQSENVLFKFLVVPDYEVLPEPKVRDYLPWRIAFLVVFLSFFLLMGILVIRDQRHEDDYKKGVRALREGRRKADRKRTVETEHHEDGAATDAEDDERS